MIPHNSNNINVLYDFIVFWNKYCKQNDAQELYNYGNRGFKIKIFKEKKEIRWKGYLIDIEGNLNLINNDNKI
jgi:hypothetical protein